MRRNDNETWTGYKKNLSDNVWSKERSKTIKVLNGSAIILGRKICTTGVKTWISPRTFDKTIECGILDNILIGNKLLSLVIYKSTWSALYKRVTPRWSFRAINDSFNRGNSMRSKLGASYAISHELISWFYIFEIWYQNQMIHKYHKVNIRYYY